MLLLQGDLNMQQQALFKFLRCRKVDKHHLKHTVNAMLSTFGLMLPLFNSSLNLLFNQLTRDCSRSRDVVRTLISSC